MNYLKLKQKIYEAIERNPLDRSAYEEMFAVCREYEKIDFQTAHAWNHELRNRISWGLRMTVCSQKFDEAREFDDLMFRSLLFGAQHFFDDYLQAVEYGKPLDKKFYQPRRHYLRRYVDAYQEILDGKLDFLSISMPKRAGKSQLGINFTNMLSGKYPDRATLMEGTGDDLVKSFYLGCLEYLTLPSDYHFYDIFPESKLVQTNADTKIINLLHKSRFPTVMCRSIDARQVGLSEATNLLYLDDCVEGREEAKNRQRLDDKWEVISGDIIGRAIEGTPIVICGTRYSLYDPMVNAYNQSQDKVKVEYSSVNQTDYTTTLVTTAYANGECPDILWVEPATFKKFSDAEMLADLSSYYTDDLKKDILPSFLEAASGDDGKIYTLPFECETLGLFYDADALEEEGIEPPKTWEELKSAAEKLTTKDRYGIVLPVEKTAYTLFNWWPFMWMDDADIYDADGNVTAGKDSMADALDFWGSFYQNEYCPSSLQNGPWSIDNVANGVAAMQIGGTYMINAAEEYNKDGHNIGVVPLPSPKGKDPVTVAGGQMMAVSSQSKDVDAAADFIFWCFGSDDTTYVTKWCTEAKFAYPARQSVIEENKELFQEGMKAIFTEFYDTARPEPQYSSEVTDIMGDTLQSVMFGGSSGADAAQLAQEQIEALN